MKKTLTSFLFLIFLSFNASAKQVEEIWYTYNGYSSFHNFSIEHPFDWQSKIVDDSLQILSPTEELEKGNYVISIREFEGKTLQEAKNYYLASQIQILEEKEEIFPSSNQKILSTVVTYKNLSDNSQFQVSFVKRGTLILTFLAGGEDFKDDVLSIYKTFKFTDQWQKYYDETSGYHFVYPKYLLITELENSVRIYEPEKPSPGIFEVTKFASTSIDSAIEQTNSGNLNHTETRDIFLNGMPSKEAIFFYEIEKKSLSYIFLEYDSATYRLTAANIEPNFPISDYYKDTLQEILSSFQFTKLEVKDGASPFNNLSDVPKTHPNSEAINSLFEQKIINGYPDGTFKPDSPINRAELTKLVVATKLTPSADTYKNCFPDVKKEWFAPYICYAKEQGWIFGYDDGKFMPSNNVNRVEALKIILLALFDQEISTKATLKSKTPLDINLSAWYGKYFIFAENSKLLDKAHIKWIKDNYNYFPDDSMTRKEVAQAIYNLRKFFSVAP